MSSGRRGGVDEYLVISGGATNPRVRAGSGTPEGAVVGSPGDVFMRIDGGVGQTFYVKETGVATNVGWVDYGQAGTKSLFIIAPSQSPQTQGSHIGSNAGVNGTGNVEFRVPADFTTLVSAEVIVIAGGTDATADIDLTSEYAATGELFDANTEADTTSTYALVLDEVAAIDVSSVLSGIGALDMVGIELANNNVTGGYLILGLRFSYR